MFVGNDENLPPARASGGVISIGSPHGFPTPRYEVDDGRDDMARRHSLSTRLQKLRTSVSKTNDNAPAPKPAA
jgi:hypothetical protein